MTLYYIQIMRAFFAVFFLFALSTSSNANPYFVVYEAGKIEPKRSEPLKHNFVFCPSSFAAKISLECVAPKANSASMYVNGVLTRKESVRPFIISGDNNGLANTWKTPEGEVSLRCTTSLGSSTSIKGKFSCPKPTMAVSPIPKVSPSPTTSAKTSPMPTTESTAEQDEKSTTLASHEKTLPFSWKYCVGLPATSHTNALPNGWVQFDKALVYRPLDDCAHCIYPPNAAVLEYKFKVPIASRYAITMESETKDPTEHNDGWIGFKNGITLIKIDPKTNVTSEIKGLAKPQKAYHNTARRYEGAFSVDGKGYSFSTTKVLEPGVDYTITFGARSTQFKFFGLFLFPCSDDNCYHHTEYYLRYLRICGVNS